MKWGRSEQYVSYGLCGMCSLIRKFQRVATSPFYDYYFLALFGAVVIVVLYIEILDVELRVNFHSIHKSKVTLGESCCYILRVTYIGCGLQNRLEA